MKKYVQVALIAVVLVGLAGTGFDTAFGYGSASNRRHQVNFGGEVLGASTTKYMFTTYLSFGMSGDAVRELQERLRAEGFFTFHTSTGYFGPITLAAVKAYQAAHGIPATGFVGPLTIAELNK